MGAKEAIEIGSCVSDAAAAVFEVVAVAMVQLENLAKLYNVVLAADAGMCTCCCA